MTENIEEVWRYDEPAYKCLKCGMTEFQKFGLGKFKKHVDECDGYSKPQQRFTKGQLVQLSNYGRSSLNRTPNNTYEVTGFRGCPSHCVKVKVVGGGKEQSYAHRYLNPVNTTVWQNVKLWFKRPIIYLKKRCGF